MKQTYELISKKVKVSNKGQITIPKKIRKTMNIEEDDVFIIRNTIEGDVVLKRKETEDPIGEALAMLKTFPKFDWRKAYEEIHRERVESDRIRQKRLERY